VVDQLARDTLLLGTAKRCTINQNGQTICCDSSGNCWSK
jgi:hypothetical protein